MIEREKESEKEILSEKARVREDLKNSAKIFSFPIEASNKLVKKFLKHFFAQMGLCKKILFSFTLTCFLADLTSFDLQAFPPSLSLTHTHTHTHTHSH